MSKWGLVALDLVGLVAAAYLAFWGGSGGFHTFGTILAAVNYIEFKRDVMKVS